MNTTISSGTFSSISLYCPPFVKDYLIQFCAYELDCYLNIIDENGGIYETKTLHPTLCQYQHRGLFL